MGMRDYENQRHITDSVNSWSGFFMGEFIFCHADHTSRFNSFRSNVLPAFYCFYIYSSDIRENISKIISKRRLENLVAHGAVPALPLFFI